MALKLSVKRKSRVPLYFQIAEQLEEAILDGRLSEEEELSDEVTLAHELGLSRPTLRQARPCGRARHTHLPSGPLYLRGNPRRPVTRVVLVVAGGARWRSTARWRGR
jgi:hypothetical protein